MLDRELVAAAVLAVAGRLADERALLDELVEAERMQAVQHEARGQLGRVA